MLLYLTRHYLVAMLFGSLSDPFYMYKFCAVAVECCFLIFTIASGIKTELADIQSNRFCNVSALWDHKH